MEKIYLAGGCFWALEAYFNNIKGAKVVSVGYANGSIENPTYEQVCSKKYNFVEALLLEFDPSIVSLNTIFDFFFKVIDPTSLNKQGNDAGLQYRTGIYYTNDSQKKSAKDYIDFRQKDFLNTIVVEVLPLENYFDAEEYHQKYLEKNPSGYCHIAKDLINNPYK